MSSREKKWEKEQYLKARLAYKLDALTIDLCKSLYLNNLMKKTGL
jgi:hypothetical protein